MRLKNWVLFSARDAEHGQELWRTDGTPEGTVQFKDLAPGPADSNPQFLHASSTIALLKTKDGSLVATGGLSKNTRVIVPAAKDVSIVDACVPLADGGRILFQQYRRSAARHELWITDGTVTGTAKLADSTPSWEEALTAVSASGFTYFRSAYSNGQLWRTDGTVAGTKLILSSSVGVKGLAALGDRVVVSVNKASAASGTLMQGLFEINAAGRLNNIYGGNVYQLTGQWARSMQFVGQPSPGTGRELIRWDGTSFKKVPNVSYPLLDQLISGDALRLWDSGPIPGDEAVFFDLNLTLYAVGPNDARERLLFSQEVMPEDYSVYHAVDPASGVHAIVRGDGVALRYTVGSSTAIAIGQATDGTLEAASAPAVMGKYAYFNPYDELADVTYLARKADTGRTQTLLGVTPSEGPPLPAAQRLVVAGASSVAFFERDTPESYDYNDRVAQTWVLGPDGAGGRVAGMPSPTPLLQTSHYDAAQDALYAQFGTGRAAQLVRIDIKTRTAKVLAPGTYVNRQLGLLNGHVVASIWDTFLASGRRRYRAAIVAIDANGTVTRLATSASNAPVARLDARDHFGSMSVNSALGRAAVSFDDLLILTDGTIANTTSLRQAVRAIAPDSLGSAVALAANDVFQIVFEGDDGVSGPGATARLVRVPLNAARTAARGNAVAVTNFGARAGSLSAAEDAADAIQFHDSAGFIWLGQRAYLARGESVSEGGDGIIRLVRITASSGLAETLDLAAWTRLYGSTAGRVVFKSYDSSVSLYKLHQQSPIDSIRTYLPGYGGVGSIAVSSKHVYVERESVGVQRVTGGRVESILPAMDRFQSNWSGQYLALASDDAGRLVISGLPAISTAGAFDGTPISSPFRAWCYTPSLSIVGTVFLDSNRNGTQDASDGGLRGWRVFIDKDNDGVLDKNEYVVRTSSTGRFEFFDLGVGTYTIRVLGYPEFAATTSSLFRVKTNNESTVVRRFGFGQ